jgi:hypothetical protein
MRVLLAYQRRLGDIIRLFPAAKALRDKGYEVWFDCDKEYHGIFKCVSYVQPVTYATRRLKFDRVLNLGIHPSSGGTIERYMKYREGKKKWEDFVYDDDLIRGTYDLIDFDQTGYAFPTDYNLPTDPDSYCLIAPFGFSQITKYEPSDLLSYCMTRWEHRRTYFLADQKRAGTICARRLCELPDVISWPNRFAAINSAPALIRLAMRRPYIHFPQTGEAAQDDTAWRGISEVVIP